MAYRLDSAQYLEAGSPPREESDGVVLPEVLRPWPVIWVVGGTIWVSVSCVSLIWLLPWSGTWFKGEYILGTAATAAKDLCVFLVTAVAYRIAITLGWPRLFPKRAGVLVLNVLLVLAVLVWSEVMDAAFAGLIDHQYGEMANKFQVVFALFWRLNWFVSLTRSYVIPYALGLCAVVLTLVVNRRHRDALEAAELARAYSAARMAILSSQLQPHFLFNSLNALAELIEEDPRQALAMVVRLGNFLRHVLASSHTPWVSVATELEGLQTYLDIQRVRFGNAVRVTVDASPAVRDFNVPSLILQPLVENAIEHGRRAPGTPPLVVSVELSSRGARLYVTIRNSRPQIAAALAPRDYGRGLSNVDLRLRAAYGAEAHLVIEPDPGGATVARLEFPAQNAAATGTTPP